MPFIVAIGDDNLSTSVSAVAEQPDTLETGTYYVTEDSENGRYKKDGSTVRPMTQAEFDAELTALGNAAANENNRRKRDILLLESDWVVTKALEAGETVPAAWVTYRQALRDMPDHTEWPNVDENDWPTKP